MISHKPNHCHLLTFQNAGDKADYKSEINIATTKLFITINTLCGYETKLFITINTLMISKLTGQ